MLPGTAGAPEEDLLNRNPMFPIDQDSFHNLLCDDKLLDFTYLGFNSSAEDIFSLAVEAPAVEAHVLTFPQSSF